MLESFQLPQPDGIAITEEPGYLTRAFFQHPLVSVWQSTCLRMPETWRGATATLQLLKFIDMECYCWSVVPADMTPMINAGMVFLTDTMAELTTLKVGQSRRN